MEKWGFWKKTLTIFVMVVLVILTIRFLMLYDLHPSRIKNPGTIVSNVMVNVLGEEYKDRDIVTRQETIQIISEVLFQLRQEGFEAVDTAPKAVSQAIDNGMLKGDEAGKLHLDDPTTKQACLTFIARGLKLSTGEGAEILYVFEDDNLIADWARAGINNLINQRYISISKIGDFLRPNDDITPTELEGFLGNVVTIKTEPISFLRFILDYGDEYPLLSRAYTFFLALLAFVQALFKVLEWFENQSIEQRKKGTICIAGAQNVGKTTLMNRLKNRRGLMCIFQDDTTQAGAGEREHVTLVRDNGDIIFDGQIIDAKPEHAITFLANSAPYKTLLFILAHTEGSDSDELDDVFLHKQRLDIEEFWAPELRAHGDSLNQVVIFINKKDLLEKREPSAWYRIYKQHFELLYKANENLSGRISVIEGSAINDEGLDKLYTQLDPASSAKRNWPKIKLLFRLKAFMLKWFKISCQYSNYG